ncbi:hypothetical protein SRHO_G00129990 [Serrasalmus rhombeus]
MAAHLVSPSSYSPPQAEPGSNSERSSDSPLHASEDDSSGHVSPPDPSWTEERFRVDRKKLETMLLACVCNIWWCCDWLGRGVYLGLSAVVGQSLEWV